MFLTPNLLTTSSRNQKPCQALKFGVLVILNSRGRKGLLATELLLLKVKSKVLSREAFLGSRTNYSMDFGDYTYFWGFYQFSLICILFVWNLKYPMFEL
ncbi:hypothetical protein RDABS01_038750 [Bienertia sinuspersici]